MSKAQITFEYNNETGRREFHIDYESEPGSLPYEHEDEHKRLVERVLSDDAEARKNLDVKREPPEGAPRPEAEAQPAGAERERVRVSQPQRENAPRRTT